MTSATARMIRHEASGGLLLIAAAIAALIVANSPLAPAYRAILHRPLGPLTAERWIDDALMGVFFLVVGLEVKRAFVDGALSRPGSRLLPVSAAACGMAAPALVYLAIVGGAPGAARGWAAPAATDIAFAQAVLLIAGRGAPASLRLFLATVAIVDDIGAVAIIAFVYSVGIDPLMLAAAAAILLAMAVLARRGVDRLWPYLLLAGLLWIAVYRSGVHATLAGVLAAAVIPVRPGRGGGPAVAHRLERRLHPWVAFAILPLFGFANAGLSLGGVGLVDLAAPIPLGIALGLFLGKQIGIGIGTALPIALGLASRPEGASLRHLHAVAVLAGIGFTMSLFVGRLAFADPHARDQVTLGVLAGSTASALLGAVLLRLARGR